MNDFQALAYIIANYHVEETSAINAIENSLKALEVLKSHIVFLDKKGSKYYFYFEGGFGFECSKEEFDLLKKELKK